MRCYIVYEEMGGILGKTKIKHRTVEFKTVREAEAIFKRVDTSKTTKAWIEAWGHFHFYKVKDLK